MDPQRVGKLPTLHDCVHCGLCLPACPTYMVTGRESESPRGRIAALRALAEERTELTAGLRAGLEDCLVCRACESACPSGISMEALMAGYRKETRGGGSDLRTRMESWFLRTVIPEPGRVATFAAAVRWLGPVLETLRFPTELPRAARRRRPPRWEVPEPEGRPRGTVTFLRGCIADHWFREEALASARVLARNGWRVVVPDASCCGALARHAGLPESARSLNRKTAEELLRTDPHHVVVDSAACAAALLEPDPSDADAVELAARITDTPTLLHEHGWEPPARRLPGTWRVAPPCHHRHGPLPETGVREVLERTLDGGYQELPGPELCCGAAGLYLQRRPRLSRDIGAESRRRFEASGADGIITGNPGCLLRWETLLGDAGDRRGGGRVLHPMVAVQQAYEL